MGSRLFGHRNLPDYFPGRSFHNIRTKLIPSVTIIGILGVNGLWQLSNHYHIRIGEQIKIIILNRTVKYILFTEQYHAVTVKITHVIRQLSLIGEPPVRINRCRKFVIRVRIVEMVVRFPTALEDLFKSPFSEGSGTSSLRISLES